jgi:hypothetical protein
MTIQPNDPVIITRGIHRGKLGRAHKWVNATFLVVAIQGEFKRYRAGSVRLATKGNFMTDEEITESGERSTKAFFDKVIPIPCLSGCRTQGLNRDSDLSL